MIKLDDIPKEMRQKRNERCAKCSTRKWYAKRLDFHFDWIDCPYDCPNDYEHLERELAKMDGEDCRTCTEWETCPNGKSGHRNGTSVGYSIGECKDYKRKGEQRW